MPHAQLPSTPRPPSDLGGLLYDVCMALREKPRTRLNNPFSYAEFNTLDSLSSLIGRNRIVTEHCTQMLTVLKSELDGGASNDQIEAFKKSYIAADSHAFPTVSQYLAHMQNLHGLTSDHSLNRIDYSRLRAMELESYDDSDLRLLLRSIRNRLQKIKQVPDAKAYAQAFEYYCEAVIYTVLKAKFSETKRIEENGGKTGSMPDFRCVANGKVFYVEVKSLDIVDAEHRHNEILLDGVQANIELERQIKEEGRQIAMAITEIAPYNKFGTKGGGDMRSLITIIDTLRAKAWQAFKTSQFKQGPTFALAVCNRLVIPGERFSLAPYYYDPFQDGAVVSGVWWQVCFGQIGGIILRQPEFAGKPSFEGYLTKSGLYVDQSRPFPGAGIITVNMRQDEDQILGLYDEDVDVGHGWTADDTKAILERLCTAFNDKTNQHAYKLSRYTT